MAETRNTNVTNDFELDPLSLPIGANPDSDIYLGRNELGEKTYRMSTGREYTIRRVMPETRFTTEAGTLDRAKEVAGQRVGDFVEGAVQAVTAPARAARGEGVTVGDAINTASAASTGTIGTPTARLISRRGVSGTSESTPNNLSLYGGELDFPNPGEANPKVTSTSVSSISKYEDPFYVPVDVEDWFDVNKNQAVPNPVFSKFSDEELKAIAYNYNYITSDSMFDSWVNSIENTAENAGVNPQHLKDVIFDLKNYNPPSVSQQLADYPIPPRQPIGEPAADQIRREQGLEPVSRPNPAADALGFTETVYHSSPRKTEFTQFKEGDRDQSLFDGIGTHVGTSRAAADRWFQNTESLGEDATGFTMELRARTDKPATEFLSTFLGDGELVGDALTEEQVNFAIKQIADLNPERRSLSNRVNNYFDGRGQKSDIDFVSDYLTERGYTHIPYKNDVEDVGSTSYIMLTSRRNGPAVLRDSRAAFDPERINERDLRFAEGGEVKSMEKQMSLFEEGGLADDGMTREPVTGNEVPAGSMAKEVRDDVPAMLSEGEYVVPADVVRFFGVKFFEDLRSEAKSDMMAMERDGRVGGEPVSDDGIPMDDELTPEEEAMLAEAMAAEQPAQMAKGGVVRGYATGGDVTVPQSTAHLPTSPYMMGGSPYGAPGMSGGFEARQYINPETGQMRTFQFLNGRPVSLIPQGFIPATQEAIAAAQAGETTADTTATEGTGQASGTTRSEDSGGANIVTTTGGGSSGGSQTSNYGPTDVQGFVDVNDPMAAANSYLEGGGFNTGSILGGIAGLALAGPGGAKMGAQLGGKFGDANNLAKAAANAEVADILGYDVTDLNNEIQKQMDSLGIITGSVAANQVQNARDLATKGFFSVDAETAQNRDIFQSDEAFQAAMEEVAPTGMTYDPTATTTVTNPSTGQESAVTGVYRNTESADDTATRLGGTNRETTDSGVNVYQASENTVRPSDLRGSSNSGSSSSSSSSDSGSSSGGFYKAVTGKAFKDTKLGKFLSGNKDD